MQKKDREREEEKVYLDKVLSTASAEPPIQWITTRHLQQAQFLIAQSTPAQLAHSRFKVAPTPWRLNPTRINNNMRAHQPRKYTQHLPPIIELCGVPHNFHNWSLFVQPRDLNLRIAHDYGVLCKQHLHSTTGRNLCGDHNPQTHLSQTTPPDYEVVTKLTKVNTQRLLHTVPFWSWGGLLFMPLPAPTTISCWRPRSMRGHAYVRPSTDHTLQNSYATYNFFCHNGAQKHVSQQLQTMAIIRGSIMWQHVGSHC